MVGMECLRDQVEAMLRQEASHYTCTDYLTTCSTAAEECSVVENPIAFLEECANVVTDFAFTSHSQDKTYYLNSSMASINDVREIDQEESTSSSRSQLASWRKQMFRWSCAVMDCTGPGLQDTVAVAFNLLDRYLAQELALSDLPVTKEEFQVFSVTCLYMAVKLSCRTFLSIPALIDMSRGCFTAEDIYLTEQDILTLLDWHLHPPTALAFCRIFGELLLPCGMSSGLERTFQSIAQLAVADPSFITRKASVTGMATLVLSCRRHNIPEETVQGLLAECKGLVDVEAPEFRLAYKELEDLTSCS